MKSLRQTDPAVADALKSELMRQQNGLELIASENFTSVAVLQAMGSVLTNKYSEGYPEKRYYGGNRFVDIIETLAINRAKKLFNADHANVQPHAGSPANLAAYNAVINPGDKIMGMSLAHGGHLTHGHKVSITGKIYKAVQYGVDEETEMLNYDMIKRKAEQEKPNLIIAGYTAYPREIDFKAFKEIADSVGAFFLVDMAHIAGLIAAGVHSTPFPYADIVTTTTHKTLRGPRGGMILCKEEHATAIDKAVFPGLQGGPLEHIIAGKAVAFKEALEPEFKEYAAQIVKNAKVLAQGLMDGGLRLCSGGTDNHLMLVDVTSKGLTGSQAETVLEEVYMTVNKNMIPFDKRKPMDPSGIRIGTPALTTRGMKEEEMKQIAELIVKVLENPTDNAIKQRTKADILQLCDKFPLYPELDY